MSVSRTLVLGFLMALVSFACKKMDLRAEMEPEPLLPDNPLEVVAKLNMNVEGLKNLATAFMSKDSVAIYSIRYNADGSVLYQLNMRDGKDVELYSKIIAGKMDIPELSMTLEAGTFYWVVNGSILVDLNTNGVSVTDETLPLAFVWQNDHLCYIIGNTSFEYLPTKASEKIRDVAINYDIDNRMFEFHLASGFVDTLPTVASFRLLREGIINQSFYKDVFLDAGIGLTSRKSLAAASFLGLSLEGVRFSRSGASREEFNIQNEIIGGSEEDYNGRLLYPDGQPRYKLLFVNGGSSKTHGKSLDAKSLENIRFFVQNGGSYVGTCAGAFFASNGYDGNVDYPYYLSIWPGMTNHTGLSGVYSGMFIEEDSPLLQFYDFGGDHYVDSVRHNLGGYPVDSPFGTEILARYDYPDKSTVHYAPSVWAYKSGPSSGRIVQTGSHPEEVSKGERRDLTAAMIQYAIEGRGCASIKGFLRNGETRMMNKTSADQDVAHARIGDLQTHHFVSYIPPEAKDIQVKVNCSCDCILALMMCRDTYAFSDTADFLVSDMGSSPRLFFHSIQEGLWYISVQCMTTVDVEETEYGQVYSGNMEVLNGIPYSLSVCWN